MRILYKYLALIGLLIYIPYQGRCHGDLDQRIRDVSIMIKSHSDSTYLYYKRGKLYYQHEEYGKALKDLLYYKHNSISTTSQEDITLSRIYADLGYMSKALEIIDEALLKDSINVQALRLKGQILFQARRYKAAALIFDRVIDYSSKTLPVNFYESSEAWQHHKSVVGENRSIEVLQQGIKEVGPIIGLYQRLVDLEMANGNHDMAIVNQMAILNLSRRKERPYYQLGELYYNIGDNERAKHYFSKALHEIQNLHESKKNGSSVVKLTRDIKIYLHEYQ